MACPIEFRKEDAERWLAAIKAGGPLEPPGGRWNRFALLAVAGACHFAAMSHGPVTPRPDDPDWAPPEYREARQGTFLEDITDAIGFCSRLTKMVEDGNYDEYTEPVVRAVISSDADGKHFRPITGFKGDEDD